MFRQCSRSAIMLLSLCSAATCQVLTIPGSTNRFSNAFALDAIQSAQMDFNFFTINSKNENLSPLQTPSGSVSNLDLKAPGKARREYQKGYLLLMRNDSKGAIEYLARATTLYPKYVAAHNALGSAYLKLQQNQEAKDQFSEAVSLGEGVSGCRRDIPQGFVARATGYAVAIGTRVRRICQQGLPGRHSDDAGGTRPEA